MDKSINKDVQEFASGIKRAKLIKPSLPWDRYLEGKELLIYKMSEGSFNLLAIRGEKGLNGLCEYAWENDKGLVDEAGYKSLKEFEEEVELGNDGFGFDKDEIELLKG